MSGERAGHGHPHAGSRLAQPQQEERGSGQVGGFFILKCPSKGICMSKRTLSFRDVSGCNLGENVKRETEIREQT